MTELIGRDNQIEALKKYLQLAINGRLQIVFVTGEAGIGKTVLVSTFIRQVKVQYTGIFIGNSQCQAITGSQQESYLPFTQIMEMLTSANEGDTTWDKLRRGIVELAPDWLQVVPGVGDLAAATIRTLQWGQSEFGHRTGGTDTNQRMVQYTRALRLASQTTPLLLWIDDLHWADMATLDLISFLSEHVQDARILLIATYRPTDILPDATGQPHPLKRLTDKLARYQQSEEIALPSFNKSDLARFLVTSRHQFPDSFVGRIWQHSGGNPLFIREYVNLLHACKLVKRQEGFFILVQSDVEIEMPSTVQAVIEQRLALIGPDLQRVLTYASVQGEQFNGKVLTQLLQTDEIPLLEQLNQLERNHYLIQELPSDFALRRFGHVYQFTHTLVREAIYRILSHGQRQHLHVRVAESLKTIYGSQSARYASTIAMHYEQGADLISALPYYLQAGENALSTLALDDALKYANTVQRLATDVQSSGLLDELTIAQLPAPQIDTAQLRRQLIDSFNEGEFRTLCFDLRINYDVLPGEGLADKSRELTAYCERDGRLFDLLAACESMRPNLVWRKDPETQKGVPTSQLLKSWLADAMVQIARITYLKGEYEQVIQKFHSSVSQLLKGKQTEQAASLYYWHIRALQDSGKSEEAAEAYLELKKLVETKLDEPLILGLTYTLSGEFNFINFLSEEEIAQSLEQAVRIARAHQYTDLLIRVQINKAWFICLRENQASNALSLARDTLKLAKRHKLLFEEMDAHESLAYVYRRMKYDKRNYEFALKHTESAERLANKFGLYARLGRILIGKAGTYLETREDWRQSLQIIEDAWQLSLKYNFSLVTFGYRRWFQVALGLGLWKKVNQIQVRFRKHIEKLHSSDSVFYWQNEGDFYFVTGQYEQAVKAYNQAMDISDRDSTRAKAVQPFLGIALISNEQNSQGLLTLESAYEFWRGRNRFWADASQVGLAIADIHTQNCHSAIRRLNEIVGSNYARFAHGAVEPHIHLLYAQAFIQLDLLKSAYQYAFKSYEKLKKWEHFMLGEAAFAVGKVLVLQGQVSNAKIYLSEAHNEWQRLGLTHHFPSWEAFVKEHDLIITR